MVLGLELRVFTLSLSASPIFCDRAFRDRVLNYLPRLASNCDPPDLCLLSSRIIGVSHLCLVGTVFLLAMVGGM
jgi:hypothetical protein